MAKNRNSIVTPTTNDPTKANLPLIDRPKNKGKRAVTPPTEMNAPIPTTGKATKVAATDVVIEVEGKTKSVKIPVRTPTLDAQIEELKEALIACEDPEEKKRIRRNLRAKGWFGGTRSRAGDATRGAHFDALATTKA